MHIHQLMNYYNVTRVLTHRKQYELITRNKKKWGPLMSDSNSVYVRLFITPENKNINVI